jgi:hypothetical protein
MRALICSPWIALAVGACSPAPAPAEPPPATVATVRSPVPGSSSPIQSAASSGLRQEAIAVCEQYRKAVEARDADALIALASPSYYEDGGNDDPSDDIDYAGLRAYLLSTFGAAEAVRYSIDYRDVRQEGNRVLVSVVYSAGYKVAGKGWVHQTEANELVLERRGGNLLFVSGM